MPVGLACAGLAWVEEIGGPDRRAALKGKRAGRAESWCRGTR